MCHYFILFFRINSTVTRPTWPSAGAFLIKTHRSLIALKQTNRAVQIQSNFTEHHIVDPVLTRHFHRCFWIKLTCKFGLFSISLASQNSHIASRCRQHLPVWRTPTGNLQTYRHVTTCEHTNKQGRGTCWGIISCLYSRSALRLAWLSTAVWAPRQRPAPSVYFFTSSTSPFCCYSKQKPQVTPESLCSSWFPNVKYIMMI